MVAAGSASGARRPLEKRDFTVAALVALAVFALHRLLTGGFSDLLGNFTKYPAAVAHWANGTLGAERALDYSQLYLRLVIWVERISADPTPALTLVQHLLVALAAALLFLAARRRVGLLPALAAPALFALYQGTLAYSWIFEPEPLVAFCLCLTLALADSEDEKARAAAGLALALAVLARPSFWPLSAAIPLCWRFGDAKRPTPAVVGAFLGAFAGAWLALSLALAPGGPSLSAMNPGTVVFDGANASAYGATADYPELSAALGPEYPDEKDAAHVIYRVVARASEGREMSRGEVNAFWAGKALAFAADHPFEAAKRGARKIRLALSSHRWHDLRVAMLADRELAESLLPLAAAGPLAALALTGAYLRRRKLAADMLPWAAAGLQLALMAVAYASERQRLALIPFLAFLSALALAELAKARRKLAPAALFVALALLFSASGPAAEDDSAAQVATARFSEKNRAAASLAIEGRPTEAAKAHAQALAWSPGSFRNGSRPPNLPGSWAQYAEEALREFDAQRSVATPGQALDRAVLLLYAGRAGEAEQALAELEESGASAKIPRGRAPRPDYYIALAKIGRGDAAGAKEALERADRQHPGNAWTAAALFALTTDGDYREKLNRWFDRLDAAYYIGLAALDFGRPEIAVPALGEVAAALPAAREPKVALAAALADAGRFEAACNLWMEAMKTRSSGAYEEKILRGFDGWAAGRGPGEFPRFVRAKALRQFGRFAEAREELAKIYEASGREVVAAELAAVEREIAAL